MKSTLTRSLLFLLCCLLSFGFGAFLMRQADQPPITASVVKQASVLNGLEFTQAEIDSMLSGLQDLRKDYDTLRKVNLTNDIAPALSFNPLPVGMKLETTQKP